MCIDFVFYHDKSFELQKFRIVTLKLFHIFTDEQDFTHRQLNRTDFREISYWEFLRISIDKTQALSISDKNNRHFTRRPTYIYDYLSYYVTVDFLASIVTLDISVTNILKLSLLPFYQGYQCSLLAIVT